MLSLQSMQERHGSVDNEAADQAETCGDLNATKAFCKISAGPDSLVMASIKAGEDGSDTRIKELYKELSSSINMMKFLY